MTRRENRAASAAKMQAALAGMATQRKLKQIRGSAGLLIGQDMRNVQQ